MMGSHHRLPTMARWFDMPLTEANRHAENLRKHPYLPLQESRIHSPWHKQCNKSQRSPCIAVVLTALCNAQRN